MPNRKKKSLKLSRRAFTAGVAAIAGAAAIARGAAKDARAAAIGPDAELCLKPASEVRRLFALKKLSPVEFLKAQIGRIEALNGAVNCITFRHFDEALKAAAESEARYMRGDARPLEGLTVALKDEHDRAGWVVTMGSLLYKDAPPAKENCAIVDMLEAAGAVMHIQTTVPEMYLEGITWTKLWGVTRNPWNPYYTPGGSSGGSGAALAAGFATLATGSDMAGSIRLPASFCGLYGFKPPFGRVPTSEIAYESSGPLARTFLDMIMMQNAISGPSPKAHSALRPKLVYPEGYAPLSGMKLAVDYASGIMSMDDSVSAAMGEALAIMRGLGCTVEEVDIGFAYPEHFEILFDGLMATGIGDADDMKKHRDKLTRYAKNFIDDEGESGPAEAAKADKLVARLHRAVQEKVFAKGFDGILMPTLATPYLPADFSISADKEFFTINGEKKKGDRWLFTWPWNLLSRYPVVNVPIGAAPKNMPVGMQIVANTYDDLTCMRIAAGYAQAGPKFFSSDLLPTFAEET